MWRYSSSDEQFFAPYMYSLRIKVYPSPLTSLWVILLLVKVAYPGIQIPFVCVPCWMLCACRYRVTKCKHIMWFLVYPTCMSCWLSCMLKTVTRLPWHEYMSSSGSPSHHHVSKSVSVPTTTTGSSSDFAIVNAVETISVSASASTCLTRMALSNIFSRRLSIRLFLLLPLAKSAACVVLFGVLSWNMISISSVLSVSVQLPSLKLCYHIHRRHQSIELHNAPGCMKYIIDTHQHTV